MRNQGFGPNELWDLDAGPTEHRNLVDEPSRRGDVRRLRGALVAWLRRYGDGRELAPEDAGGASTR